MHMKTKILILVLLAVVLGGGVWWYSAKDTTAPSTLELEPVTTSTVETTNEPESVPEPEDPRVPAVKSYTLAEIAAHATAADCWFAVEGKVYNVTPFIASGKHPGGEAILMGCGKDATSLFNAKPSNGQPHSPKAREGLANFYIGELAK